jgi:hypothetical protein
MSTINLAVKPKVTEKTKSEVIKPKAKVKAMDPKDYKGTYKYDKDSRIQVCVDKNPKREGCGGWTRFNLYNNGMKIRDFLKIGGKTIDLDWDRERGFVAVEVIDEVGRAGKSEKATFTLKK